MRLHLSPFSFLRRHAWGLAVLLVLIAAYFIGIGWIGGKLRDDIGTAYKPAPSVDDRGHKAE
jgi:hypothetical protein